MGRRDKIEGIVREITEFAKDHRTWLAPVALLLVLNLVFFAGFTARSDRNISRLKVDVDASRNDLKRVLADLDKNDRKKALSHLVERELDDMYANILLRYDENFQNVRLELQSIMKQVNIDTSQISYHRAELPDFSLIQDTISFPLKGNYHSLRRLLSLLEQSEQFLIIDSIQLADSTNEGKELNLSISVLTYYFEPRFEQRPGKRRPL